MKEINWQDLKSFLTALAVGDYKSVANTILEEPVEGLVFDYDLEDQEFVLGEIELNTKSADNVGSQLNQMVKTLHKVFATANSASPANIIDGYIFDYLGLSGTQHRMIDYGVDDYDNSQFIYDPNNLQETWLREYDADLSRKDLLNLKFKANLYAHFIIKFGRVLALDSNLPSSVLKDSERASDQAFANALIDTSYLNSRCDYGDLSTSLMDLFGLYENLTDRPLEGWTQTFFDAYTQRYDEHDQHSWNELSHQLQLCVDSVDKILGNTKFRVETFANPDDGYHPWGFKIGFNLHGSWYRWITLTVENDCDDRYSYLSQVKYSKSIGKLVPKSFYEGIATKTLCPSCNAVANRHNETLPFMSVPLGISRVLRVCFDCVNYYARGYSMVHKCFVDNSIRGTVFVPVSQARIDELLSSMTQQNLRNIKRNPELLAFFTAGSDGKLMEVRFIPDTYFYDYNHELDWHLYMIENDAYNIIRSDSSNHGPTTVSADAAQKSFFTNRERLPMGMELEIQYRDEDTHSHSKYIEQLLIPLHRKYPYDKPSFGTAQQLAIGSRDSSIGLTGVEFKFQIMSSPFVADLPEDFFETLKNEWRGYHAKKCGIHLSTSKSALNRPESFVMLTYHNNHVRAYRNLSEDALPHNIMGDVFQRVDVPDYSEWHEVRYSANITRDDYQTGRDFRYASYLEAVVRNRQSVSRGNFINFASAENNRLEFRAFASATLKDRLLKNFEYVDAIYQFSRHLAQNLPDGLVDIRDIPADELELIHTILDNEIGFYFWLDKTGGFRAYPNLAAHLERHNIDKHLSNYVGDIPDALQDVFVTQA